ncbi:hypothetical protein A2U01_0090730, partial [Trifolium medium]|nr:hypothetical protein [Trifolium medium]
FIDANPDLYATKKNQIHSQVTTPPSFSPPSIGKEDFMERKPPEFAYGCIYQSLLWLPSRSCS